MNFDCGPGSFGYGWHMGGLGGWFMPGLFILILFGIFVWRLMRRQPTPFAPALSCPECAGGIQASFFRCPHCGKTLKHNCPNCSRIIEHGWSYCPFCSEVQSGETSSDNKVGH